MPLLSNYHTHSRYDDGQGELEDYVLAALAKGFKLLGFSGHAPLPFETCWNMKSSDFESYKGTVLELKRKYAGQIELLLGLEVDFIPGVISPVSPEIANKGLDYTLGSVHFIGQFRDGSGWTVDGPRAELEKGLLESFDGDIQLAAKRYYALMTEMLLTAAPDIVGHFDLIKKNNKNGDFFAETESWYRRAIAEALAALKRSGAVMEINTGGLARQTSCALYPSEWILAECAKMEIPIVLNSDAHAPGMLDACFDDTRKLLKALGFKNLQYLTAAGWKRDEIF